MHHQFYRIIARLKSTIFLLFHLSKSLKTSVQYVSKSRKMTMSSAVLNAAIVIIKHVSIHGSQVKVEHVPCASVIFISSNPLQSEKTRYCGRQTNIGPLMKHRNQIQESKTPIEITWALLHLLSLALVG